MKNVLKEFKNRYADKALILIVILILPVNIVLLISTEQIVKGVENRAVLSLQSVADIFMNTMDSDMERIDYYLYSSCVNNSDFLELAETESELRYENAKYRCQMDMQEEIAMSGNCDAMFVSDPERQETVVGTSVGTAKRVYEAYLDREIRPENRWKICSPGRRRISGQSDEDQPALLRRFHPVGGPA